MNMKLAGNAVTPMFVSALRTPKSKEEKEADDKLLLEKQKADEAEQARLKKQQEAQKKLERESELKMLNEQLESSKEEAEGMAKEFSALSKCMVIATRIMRGDIVPIKDMKFLAEHEADLYKQAILMRRPNSKPKKWDSILDDEDMPEDGEESVAAEDMSLEQMEVQESAGEEFSEE